MDHLALSFFSWGTFITAAISLLIIGLFKFSFYFCCWVVVCIYKFVHYFQINQFIGYVNLTETIVILEERLLKNCPTTLARVQACDHFLIDY